MPKRFAATEHAVEKGLENTTPAAGAKLVAEWVTELEAVESPGAKKLHDELKQLHDQLTSDAPNGATIKKILGRIGGETEKLAKSCEDPAMAGKIKSLGEALSHAAG